MRAVVIAAGDAPANQDWERWLRPGDLIVAADGGASRAMARGLLPDVVVGDLDSTPADVLAALEAQPVEIVRHPRAKDETDLELALCYAAGQSADEIVVLGALGGRLDHTLSNLLLLALPELKEVAVRIVRGAEEAVLVRSGERVALHGQPGDVVSLLPWGGDVRGVTTSGLTWPLAHEALHFAFSRGVSNVMTGQEAWIEVEEGNLMVVHGPGPAEGSSQ
ncbi:MAG: thiamine diphosphokinase [Anaerolineae bacterium]|nr:thiamine diphosphokinase [Anaerolineae bacterium]